MNDGVARGSAPLRTRNASGVRYLPPVVSGGAGWRIDLDKTTQSVNMLRTL